MSYIPCQPSPLMENAKGSIRIGIEDYFLAKDKHDRDKKFRMISALRNIYAGILIMFKERLLRLSEGLATYLYKDYDKNGINISGGEAQKIAIARALYKDAPFIILDEPTAALDPIAESELYQKYHELTKNKSSIYISHRLASTRFCDRIIMIGDGGICEEGTHEELIKQGGKYAKLYEVQSKYYKEGDEENG